MADPTALLTAVAAAQAVEFVGLPEARINLAQAVIHISLAPKSNAVIKAISAADADVRNGLIGAVPAHLRDATILGRARSVTARATSTRTTSTTASSRSATLPIRWRTASTTSRRDMARRPASPSAPGGSGPSSASHTPKTSQTTRSSHDADGPVRRHGVNAVDAAALIAAVFWALLVSVGVFVLFRLGRLLSESQPAGRRVARAQ